MIAKFCMMLMAVTLSAADGSRKDDWNDLNQVEK